MSAMRLLLPVLLTLTALSCSAPEHDRWTLGVPIGVGLGEDADMIGLRFQDEIPVHPQWTVYFAASALDIDADGSDAGSASDIDDVLLEANFGVRRYLGDSTTFKPYLAGEVGIGNSLLFDTLDGVDDVYSASAGAGIRVDLDRDWSLEAGAMYRYSAADVDSGAYPGLDFEDAITGLVAFVGIGYVF